MIKCIRTRFQGKNKENNSFVADTLHFFKKCIDKREFVWYTLIIKDGVSQPYNKCETLKMVFRSRAISARL